MAYREERFTDALIQFQKLIRSYPSSSYRDEAQYWMAWSLFRRKDFEKAIEEFQRLVEGFPSLLIARLFRFCLAEFFEIELASQRAVPRVGPGVGTGVGPGLGTPAGGP
jgi:tetratricopeptide (TPR) repeat protein